MPDPNWYYEKDNQPWGPLYDEEVQILIREGSITADTLLWTEPMEEWSPASSIDKFRHFFVQTPPPLPQTKQPETPSPQVQNPFQAPPQSSPPMPGTETPNDAEAIAQQFPETEGVPQVRPWARFGARMFDYLIFTTILGLLYGLFGPENEGRLSGYLTFIYLFAWIFVEAFFISLYGSTPGKYLMNTRVLDEDGDRLSYSAALNRSASVWLKGIAFGIPFVSLVTMLFAFVRLNKEGQTSWDKNGEYRVVHGEIDSFNLAMVTIIISVLIAAVILALVLGLVSGLTR